ncbi:hypothetical protein FA15DRAFT_666970 [Coprinopsis marcescibilis]|uniref:TECPR1-like DysF domain-containing protein n=1 Tax=Coprinopsis marcescibilis TaxID=230819 RepID=A0A5C3L2S3_COPMA|nr:hypothetical protein FA15DRAFT_666970 [Coprinopsis marcescibilis]
MAALDYVDIPPGATRLRSASSSTTKAKPTKSIGSMDIRPAPQVFTSLPNPSPPSSPRRSSLHRSMSLSSTAASALASPTLGFIPQLVISSTFPGISSTEDSENGGSSNPRQRLDPEKYTLLSTKDPLSLPIMTNNFKRFVSKIGPVFWLQDRVEEIVLWKRGWKVTCVWMALYAFLCFFPRLILLVPHAAVIAIILATYPYPQSSQPFSQDHSSTDPTAQPAQAQPATEGSIPWQANIQGIQNLMGAVSDLFTAVEPHVYHLVLSPAHFKDPKSFSKATSSTDTDSNSTQPVSPYTPHLLTLLVLSFPFMAFVVSLPWFPIREVCLVGGLLPFLGGHPHVRKYLLPLAVPMMTQAAPLVIARVQQKWASFEAFLQDASSSSSPKWKVVKILVSKLLGINLLRGTDSKLSKSSPDTKPAQDHATNSLPAPQPIPTLVQRIIDNDRLTDMCWNSEMHEVELWENERFGTTSGDGGIGVQVSGEQPAPSASKNNKWSKGNLRAGERTAWTRGRDGWSGIGGGYAGSGIEEGGEVSNLTFSLAPGWAFVETEDWRKDVLAEWSGVGADEDGWVYTNDAWLGPRPSTYTAGGGSVTRRRRWTRRVWYDVERAKQETT